MFDFILVFGMVVSAYWVMDKTIDFLIRKMHKKGR